MVPDPADKSTRIAAYQWMGFGFSGLDDAAEIPKCARLLQ
jgi:hypothetical protein